jgi:hypothetical protein
LRTGNVVWESTTFRATGAPIDLPIAWEIRSPEEWVAASHDRAVRAEYEMLRSILTSTDPIFHSAFVRERSLWKNKTPSETIQAANLALLLSPGCAEGRPLRALSLAGIDSKFFERHRSLIVRLLDIRHDGEASRQGLETFLDAWRESDHWLLLADLGHRLTLSFPRMRVRASDLAATAIPASAIVIVENESCLHLLPQDLPGVIAILGTGNNLAWLNSSWLQNVCIAYWGDLDTWGLSMLSRARSHAPHLTPLLMTREVFDLHKDSAVPESTPASDTAPTHLTADEAFLYQHLLDSIAGRLEQEFLPASLVQQAVRWWAHEG